MNGQLKLKQEEISHTPVDPSEHNPPSKISYIHRASYFRSRVYSTQTGVNPLVAAAQPIFSIIDRLKLTDNLPKLEGTCEHFEHEVRAFESRVRAEGYSNELTIIAHYLITATIDEIVEKRYIKQDPQLNVHDIPKLTPKPQSNQGPEQRFFDIIEHVLSKSELYLDLVELIYFCLNSGFSGRYLNESDGRESLESITDKVYEAVEQYRANKDRPIFLNRKKRYLPVAKPRNFRWLYIVLASILFTFCLYGMSHLILDRKANELIAITKSKPALLTQRSMDYDNTTT